MSANRLSLSSKPVIAGVLVAMAAVVVLNVRTFGPQTAGAGRTTVRMQSAPPYPMDIAEVIQADRSTALDPAPPREPLPEFRRDPFYQTAHGSNPIVKAKATRSPTRPRPAPRCTAVFPAGREPLAVIDGRSCRIGDRVGDYRLTGIGIDGVVLVNKSGRELTLAVGTPTTSVRTNGLVTSLRNDEQDGGTRLDEPERNLP